LETTEIAIFDALWLPELFHGKLCFLAALAEPKIQLYSYEDGKSNSMPFKNKLK
jgi:hypothetical protein